MSKQLAISSAFSIFAMAAFALFGNAEGDTARIMPSQQNVTGAIEIAPATLRLPAVPVPQFFRN